MEERRKRSSLQRPFIIAGAVAGAFFSGYYLYRSIGGSVTVPDPVWLRFVKVALIMFCSIYLANLVRRGLERRDR